MHIHTCPAGVPALPGRGAIGINHPGGRPCAAQRPTAATVGGGLRVAGAAAAAQQPGRLPLGRGRLLGGGLGGSVAAVLRGLPPLRLLTRFLHPGTTIDVSTG